MLTAPEQFATSGHASDTRSFLLSPSLCESSKNGQENDLIFSLTIKKYNNQGKNP
jgi:hypothetical protein